MYIPEEQKPLITDQGEKEKDLSEVPPERHEKLPGKNPPGQGERLPGKDEKLSV